jgi:general secretion pathway protein G
VHASLERLRKRRTEEGEEGGFTLIELLIVIVILGILAAIVVFAVQNLSTSSSKASCGSDYTTVETAVETYKAQMGNYPDGAGSPLGNGIQTDTDATSTVTAGGAAPAVNAAGASAGAGSELLVPSATAPNLGAPGAAGPVGPWLRDVPLNNHHYQIVVSNDGTGTVGVIGGAGGAVIGVSKTACSDAAVT